MSPSLYGIILPCRATSAVVQCGVWRRDGITGKGSISRRNGALYGNGPGAGKDGPFPEEYNLAWQ
jgi:hypothetical protein